MQEISEAGPPFSHCGAKRRRWWVEGWTSTRGVSLQRRRGRSGDLWRGSEGLKKPQRGLASGAAAAVGKRRRLAVGETRCVEVMNAARGGHGFQALDWPLADGACFLSSVGLPQLEHAVLEEPIDLTDPEGVVLGST